MCPHRFRAVVGGWSVPECGGPGDVSGCRRGPGLHHGVCEAAPGDAVTGGPSPAGRSPQTASRDPPQVPAGPGARRRSSCGPELSVPTSRAEPAGWLLGFRGRCSPLLRGSLAPPTSASLGAWPGAEPLERERVCPVEMGPDLEVRESRRKRPLPLSWQVLGQQWLVASTGDKEGPRMSDLALQEEKD